MPVNSFENYPMSWKPVLLRGKQPLYLALAERLEEDIRLGKLLPGAKLPPQRELADFLDVNLSTVTRAFRLANRKGLIGGSVGSGTFVSYDALSSRPTDAQALIDLGSVMPEPGDFREIFSILKKMMSEPDFGALFGYGASIARDWQREAAARRMAKAGFAADPACLLTANGAQNALAAILAGLFEPGDRIGVDPLTYPGVKNLAKMLGITLVPVEQRAGEMSEEGIAHAARAGRIRALYIMPDYQNPTTHTLSLHGRESLARAARKWDLLILEDAVHSLLNPSPLPAVASFSPERTLYIAGLSKTVLPGLRLSHIAVPPRLFPAVSEALANLNLTVSPFLLELASRVIASEQADRITAALREKTRARNRLVNQILADFPVLGAPECIFRWLLLPDGWGSESFESLAEQRGVQVYGAHRFAVGAARPVEAVRLAVGAPKDLSELEQALLTLRDLLGSRPSA